MKTNSFSLLEWNGPAEMGRCPHNPPQTTSINRHKKAINFHSINFISIDSFLCLVELIYGFVAEEID